MLDEHQRTITAIEPQKGGRGRMNIFFDRVFAFSLDPVVVEECRLYPGMELTGEQVSALLAKDDGEEAYQAALLLLGFRKRSKREIRDRLLKRGFSDDVTVMTIRRLEERGLVDDKAFTEFWKDNRESFKPRGKRLMAHEVRKAGVDPETIEGGLKDVDEVSGAYRAASARMKSWISLERDAFRKKAAAFLFRRGYGWDVITETVERLWQETRDKTALDTK